MPSHKSNKSSSNNTTMLVVVAVILSIVLYMLYSGNAKEGFSGNLEPTGNEFKMVLFHATWCGHCQKFMPEWNKASNELKKNGGRVNGKTVSMVKVDADENGELVKEYDVSGFPTVKVMSQGKIVDYDGDRSMSGLMKYIKRATA